MPCKYSSYLSFSLKPSNYCGPFQGLQTPFHTILSWTVYIENFPGTHWVWWIFENMLRNELFYYLVTLIILYVWKLTRVYSGSISMTTFFQRRAVSHFPLLLLSVSSLTFSGKSLRDGKSSSGLYDSRLWMWVLSSNKLCNSADFCIHCSCVSIRTIISSSVNPCFFHFRKERTKPFS